MKNILNIKKLFIMLNLITHVSLILCELEIREPLPEEIQEVADVYYYSWHDTYGILAPHLSSERTRDNCLKKWEHYNQKKNKIFILIAIQDKKVVGLMYAKSIQQHALQAEYDSEIDKLYILPDYKNQGIGSALINAAFVRLRNLGFKKPIVQSLMSNTPANLFYEKHGGILIMKRDVEFGETMNVYGFQLR